MSSDIATFTLSANGKLCQYRYIYDHKKENCTSDLIPFSDSTNHFPISVAFSA